jgi:DNA-binding response OmpR family regulator/ligand-binding sensor domain-containing protein
MTCLAQRPFQSSEYQLLNMNHGLCNNTITDIEQDATGILWMSTDAGISRYDGVTFYSRTLADKEPVALANLMPTEGDLVWSMAKFRPRVCCFNRMTGRFVDVEFTTEGVLPHILNIRLAGQRLMAVTPQALYELEYELTDPDHVRVTPRKVIDSTSPFVNIFGGGDVVYMSTADKQLVLYNTATARTERIAQESLLIQDPSHIRHSYMGENHLWLCSDREGLICYSLKDHRVRRINLTEPENGIREARIFDIAKMNDTVYIVSTRSSVLKMTFQSPHLTQADYRITDLTPNREAYGGLLNERINCIYFDNSNRTLWVGTQGSGLMKLRLWADDILQIAPQKEMGRYHQIAQGAKGYLWIATETGLWRDDAPALSTSTHFTRWKHEPSEGSHCLYRDSEGNLWVGNELGEVICINTHTDEETRFRPLQPDGLASVGAIQRLCLNSHNHLWLVTETGLAVFDPVARQTLAYRSFESLGFEVSCLYEDSDGSMWLGTTHGLHLCTRKGAQLTAQNGYERQMGMNAGLVRSLYINRYGQLFAAYTNKILTLDDKSKQLTGCLLVNRELMDGHIQCMVDDRNGNTWMGSNTGISTYHNRTGQIYHYDSSCNYFDVAYMADGSLVWATSTGLLSFSPQQVKAEAKQKRLSLSGIEVNNVPLTIGTAVNDQVILDRPAYMVESLTLNHNNNNVVLTFTSMHYTTSRERVYYRLLPGNPDWTVAWDGHVKLSALKPGHYTLEVRPPMPFEGEVEALQIPLRVKCHPGLTWWAILCYILLLGGSAWAFAVCLQRKMARRRMHISEKEGLEEALDTEIERREETARTQSIRDNFHLMLAQEMRSPLAMAVVPLREMVQDATASEQTRQRASIAYHNTVYLQDICNQILAIYQQEKYPHTFRVATYAVSDLADSVVRSFHELLGVGGVELLYDKTQRIRTEVWVDRVKVTFVLSNILSNAFRWIDYTGCVELQAQLTEFEGRECALYRIRDIDQHSQGTSYEVRLSEDDFTALESQLHPAMGLEVMQGIAVGHGGDIIIRHEQGEGTEACFYLPLGSAHFAGRTNVEFVEPEIEEPDEDLETQQIEEEERRAVQDDDTLLSLRPEAPATRYTVLIIEDNADIRLYLQVLLSGKYNTLLAENGQEGIRLARKELPDLILTDIMMPVMDGLECCRILKEDLKTCHIPVIMLTALTSDEDVMKGLDSGADDYILKPFNPEILRSKIKNLIQSRVDLKRVYTRMLMIATPAVTPAAEAAEPDTPSAAAKEVAPAEDPFITVVLEQVKSNLQNPEFNVKRLAETMNMSQPTLYRKVKQLTNYTIIELIRGVRLKESAELLRTKKYSVQEVAEMVGYNDVPTFRKHFIDMYGTTPSTFN